ncbi:MAG: type I pullulanase [Prevotellaceae bacterium]|nr:type I pullulanase [Prevotellaceae bacterium]
MKIKQLTFACLAMLTSQLSASAQDFSFNEMSYSPKQTVFYLNAPTRPVVRLYAGGLGGKALKTVKMKAAGKDCWTAVVKGDQNGKFYTFDTGHGETPGVFAKAVGVNGRRGAILDLKTTDPEGWNDDHILTVPGTTTYETSTTNATNFTTPNFSNLVVYEMHFRDFSIARNINLAPKDFMVKRQSTKYPGKFLALTEPWAIDYLKDLGVNAVHILPSFDYASVDETKLDTPQYNWGYDPLNYNVPEGSYSTDPYNPATRIKEFKEMVEALHKAGIRVILDVVYNHTFDLDHSNFQLTWPNAYYRFTADGKPSNGSGCGNETASDHAIMHDFMLQSVKYWAENYHIDGFRFDLMGVHDINTMNDIRKELTAINPNIFIYGEGWSAGSCAYPQEKLAMKVNTPQMPGIAAFSDDLRDALRGPFSDDHKGAFLAGLAGSEESVKAGIAGMIAHPQVDYSKVNYSKQPWCNEPTQMIAYVSCHDDMCLVDRLKASIPNITTDELIRLDELAQTAVFTSQGVPFMLSGEEMLRDKKGVHNSYNSPDSINELNWNNPLRYPQVFKYYKNLIALRKHHPAFRLGSADLVRQHLEFLPSQDALVAFRLKDHAGGDSWKNIIVILNGNKDAKEVTVPEGQYTVVACDGQIDENGLDTINSGKVVVDGQSALIIKQ